MNARAKTKAIATRKKTGTAVAIRDVESTPAGTMATIIALAKDKSFDADKMKAMIEIQVGMMAQQAKINFIDDFHRMQEELPEIDANNKIVIYKKGTSDVIQTTHYASFPDIMKVVKPILQRNNFTLNFIESDAQVGRVTSTAVLANTRGGHTQTSIKSLPIENSGSKNDVQGYGSASSYNKRYLTIGILNLTSRAKIDRDDDGVIAGDAGMAPITKDQFHKLNAKLEFTGADKRKFCEHFQCAGIELLPQKKFDEAMRLLDQKAKKAASPT